MRLHLYLMTDAKSYGKEKSDPAVRASILESILLELKDDGRIAERIDLRFDRPAVREQFTNPQGR